MGLKGGERHPDNRKQQHDQHDQQQNRAQRAGYEPAHLGAPAAGDCFLAEAERTARLDGSGDLGHSACLALTVRRIWMKITLTPSTIAKKTTSSAEACPSRKYSNARTYASVFSVSVAKPGPPRVMV